MKISFNTFLLPDTSGNKSTTVTAFVLGFLVCLAKLAVSGMTIKGFTLAQFSGTDFAAAVGSLGAIYALRRNNTDNNSSDTTPPSA